MDAPEAGYAGTASLCSKCGLETRDARRYCPRCGFPYGSVFKYPTQTYQSLEPAIKSTVALFAINLLFLSLKIAPKSAHLPIEVTVEILFAAIVLYAVHPVRAKILFQCRRFSYASYPRWKMAALGLATAAVLHLYFRATRFLGFETLHYIVSGDLGTPKVYWVFLSAVVLAPVFEEIYFRGYLFRKFRLVLDPGQAILLQGLVFGILHLSPVMYLSHTLMGILFGYLRYRTRSLLPGMLFHALWNLSVVGAEYWRLTAG